MNSKICTSIEQSKKLIELGIDVNTADMIYQPTMDIDSMSNVGFVKIPLCIPFNEVKECNIQYLPAWSLSALFDLFPNGSILRKSDKGKYFMFGNMFDNPLDAAFEMICWLLENKKL